MITRYFYQNECIELEYTDKFHSHVELESGPYGLTCTVSLANDNDEDELIIGNLVSKEYDRCNCYNYSRSLLSDEEYCLGVWTDYIKRKKKNHAAH